MENKTSSPAHRGVVIIMKGLRRQAQLLRLQILKDDKIGSPTPNGEQIEG
ncbi:hypothetical protein C5167_039893 [Papaver somniferum]|uniref:Uncharacterized protein n=1 Tax=Papaver somniferum TaxID=3469 RepID=A0A4Y7IGV5_PAPSO|nr:hypothetical protein C5167_039893 [Papaver somniferum]